MNLHTTINSWLKNEMGLGKYVNNFLTEKDLVTIDDCKRGKLDEEYLEELGITDPMHQKKILSSLDKHSFSKINRYGYIIKHKLLVYGWIRSNIHSTNHDINQTILNHFTQNLFVSDLKIEETWNSFNKIINHNMKRNSEMYMLLVNIIPQTDTLKLFQKQIFDEFLIILFAQY
eukprot:474611_1